jgi:hypothetical protein
MTLNKKPVAKKRGRPPGSKNKTSAAKVRDNKTSHRREISRLLRCPFGSS